MKRKGAGVALLFLLACLPFLPTLQAGFLNWDDDFYLTENPDIVAPNGWKNTLGRITTDANVYPAVFATFRLERRLWGFHPRGYHTVNLVLHGLVTISAFGLLISLGVESRVAWWGSLWFAVHPMQVATVAWVSERKSLLGTFFLLLSWTAILRTADSRVSRSLHSTQWGVISLILSLFGYLSKSSLVVFPVLLMGAERLRGGRFSAWVGAHLGIALFFGWIYAGREGGPPLPLLERALLVPRSLCFYLGSWVFAAPGGGVYPKWNTAPLTIANAMACLGLALSIALLYLLRRKVDPTGWLGLWLFLVPLAPSLGLLSFGYQHHAFVSDHFAYLALLGLSLLAVSILFRMSAASSMFRSLFLTAAVIAWSAVSWSECKVWKSSEDFWTTTLSRNRDSWVAHQNLATELDRQGRVEEACAHYQEAVRIEPENPVGWINLGRSQIRNENYEAAVETLNRAIEINPHYRETYGFLAEALSRLGRFDEAITAKRKEKGE